MVDPEKQNQSEFEKSSDSKPPSLVREFLYFIVEYKAWWMVPILIGLGLIAVLVVLAPSGATPFIYTLF